MSNDRLKYLLEQYASDLSSPEEIQELFEWIKKSDDDSLLKEKISLLWSQHQNDETPAVDWTHIYSKVINAPEAKVRKIWPSIAVAIMMAGVIFAVGFLLTLNKNSDSDLKQNELLVHDVKAPATNRAMITLGDGSVVYLDSTSNGQVAVQGNVTILKQPDGQIGYQSSSDENGILTNQLNTLFNPKGSKVIEMTLSDGSHVWLNSGSSITYPVQFNEKERKVTLNGEAYFEIAKDASKPFTVSKDKMQVHVLGTHFNVNAYDDEDIIKVTLLEGSIKILDQGINEILKPGQQANISNNAKPFITNAVNLEAVMAWKNGRFIFDRENIQSIMRQLARWYDLNVDYEGNVTTEKFVGVFSRSRYQNISEILSMFEKTRIISFSINGKNITVMPYKENKQIKVNK